MVDFEYAARNIQGVWRIAFGGEDWREDIDRSVEGVFRSFWAIAFTAPFSLLAFVSARRAAIETETLRPPALADAPLALLMTAEMLSLLIDWAASIAALVLTAHALGAHKRAADVIICFNWAQVIATAAIALPVFLFGLTASTYVFSLLYLPAVVFAIVLLWRVLRACLPLNVGMTIALLALLTLIGIVVNTTVTGGALFLVQLLS